MSNLRKVPAKKSFLKAVPIVSLLSVLGFSAPAQATTFELGVVSSSSSSDVGNSVKGWFADAYTFTVAAGTEVTLSSLFSNIFGQGAPGISNLWATLYKSPGIYTQSGTGSFSTGADGSTTKQVALNTGLLAAGTYGLFVQGLVAPAGTASYTGNIAFDYDAAGAGGGAVTPVPEPETWAMLMLGLAGMGFVARRRLNGSQAPVDSHLA
jgi:PEP-CTERM motif-containing protein